MATASAPGKVILFGEHAVVFGEPALAMAVDLRTTVRSQSSNRRLVNGEPLNAEQWPYVAGALDSAGVSSADLAISSTIPPMAGLGSSAAVTVATLAAVGDPEEAPGALAQRAFRVELGVQGRASPIDTSTSTHGRAILVDRRRGEGYRWTIVSGRNRWYVHTVEMPSLTLVLGSTGLRQPTGPLVARVRDLVASDPGARDTLGRIGRISLEGSEALRTHDLARAGRLMVEDQECLNRLGVGHPLLDRYVETALKSGALGAKLTGAGGGGNMIALATDPAPVTHALEAAGAEVRIVRTSPQGVVRGEAE